MRRLDVNKMKDIKLETVDIDAVYPYLNNPRKNDDAVQAVAESIRQCGYIAPIIVDEDHVILAGHTRYKALQLLGYDKIQIAVAQDMSEEQKKKYRLLDNKLSELSKWDFDLLAEEIDGLDFGDLDLNWGIEIPDFDFNDDIDLENSESNAEHQDTICCPKCGFEWVK